MSIPYSEELAKKLAERWSLPESTVRNWKFRNTIPSKYLTQDEMRQPVQGSLVAAHELLTKLLDSPWLSKATLAEKAGVNIYLIRDVLASKQKMSVQEMAALAKTLRQLCDDIKRACESGERAIIEMVSQPIFHTLYVCPTKQMYYRVNKLTNGHNAHFSEEEIQQLKSNLMSFAEANDPQEVIDALNS